MHPTDEACRSPGHAVPAGVSRPVQAGRPFSSTVALARGHGTVWKSTNAFYDEVARVPLLIRYPRRFLPQRRDLAVDPKNRDRLAHLDRQLNAYLRRTGWPGDLS